MAKLLEAASRPELVFGLVAPIGVDLDLVSTVLSELLTSMQYGSTSIKITELMREFKVEQELDSHPYIKKYKQKISYANEIREEFGNESLSALCISAIRQLRKKANSDLDSASSIADQDKAKQEEVPLNAHAYIVRQFKLPEEIRLMRRVYGRQFIQISAYAPRALRVQSIKEKERDALGGLVVEEDIECDAQHLVAQDEKEILTGNGQNLRDCFPLGDVFIDASSRTSCKRTLARFIDLLFGSNRISPTFDEYGMYSAKSASLRSSALTRQVGAAVFSPEREILSLGCNEVPKFCGGTYWSDDKIDHRDIIVGHDPNERLKKELLVDLVDRLCTKGVIDKTLVKKQDALEITRHLLDDNDPSSISESKIMDIIEFGRDIHAEMSAITDAARTGATLKNSVLFCTTFPCHLCAKHIVAAGITRVVFIEPYPKSYAAELNGDSISLEEDEPDKVHFSQFIGVSPYRYRELFEKGKRKYLGVAQEWHGGDKRPMIEVFVPSYFEAELRVVESLNAMMSSGTSG